VTSGEARESSHSLIAGADRGTDTATATEERGTGTDTDTDTEERGADTEAVATPTPADLDTPPSVPVPEARPAGKPLLASEALMEDLAPVEPAGREARAWCAAFGAGFLLFGTLPLLGLLAGGFEAALPWLVTGTIALVASVTRVTYRQRAVAMVVLGLLSGVVTLQANGAALFRADGGPAWGLARLFAAVALAAALNFRARYRAYAGARVFLGTALAISVPFVTHTALRFLDPGGIGLGQVGAIAALIAVTASLTGFMGSETTGAGVFMAPSTVIAFALDIGLRAVVGCDSRAWATLLGDGAAALGFAGAATLAALGLFQILAWRFAADARRIDLHPRRDSEVPRDQESNSDWSTR
jgi:hypothetical protein